MSNPLQLNFGNGTNVVGLLGTPAPTGPGTVGLGSTPTPNTTGTVGLGATPFPNTPGYVGLGTTPFPNTPGQFGLMPHVTTQPGAASTNSGGNFWPWFFAFVLYSFVMLALSESSEWAKFAQVMAWLIAIGVAFKFGADAITNAKFMVPGQ